MKLPVFWPEYELRPTTGFEMAVFAMFAFAVATNVSTYLTRKARERRESSPDFIHFRKEMLKDPERAIEAFRKILETPNGMCRLLNMMDKAEARAMVRVNGIMSDREFLRHVAACATSRGAMHGVRSPRRASPLRSSPRRASPRGASPRSASPLRSSPRRASPRGASPRGASPRRAATNARGRAAAY